MSLFKRHPLVLAIVGIVVLTSAAAVAANLLVQHGAVSTILHPLVGTRKVHVLGSAMYPTLKDGQFVDLDTTAYAQHRPQRGDIVVFTPPTGGSGFFIKRVIATPGDRLLITNGTVYINAKAISEPYLPERWTYDNNWPASGQAEIVPSDQYFVMGDNRNHSSDSRSFGFVAGSAIQGRVKV